MRYIEDVKKLLTLRQKIDQKFRFFIKKIWMDEQFH